MQIHRLLIVSLPFLLILTSCEKADPFFGKLKGALRRDAEPKQVVGLPEDEMRKEVPPPPAPEKMKPAINKKARISFLGYHDFTETRRPTEMIIHIDEFRNQMQAIKDAELPVISMQQFLDWKMEKADIPEESVVITIDDGWKATHTLAMPVLREFGYPFTAYLYKNYVNIGGRSMSLEQIQELIEAGGTICSHSVSHDFMTRQRGRSDTEYEAWLLTELNDSHDFLIEKLGAGPVLKTFAYPFGAYNNKVMELAKSSGYEACFTVSPGKTTWETDLMAVPRYIIHGNNSRTFDAAISFGSGAGTATGRRLMSEQRDKDTGEVKGPLIAVYPPADSTVKNRLPRIEVNLSGLENVQSESLAMRVSGLGKVPHQYDSSSQIVSYQVPQRIRLSSCSIEVSFRHSGNRDKEVIAWKFNVDRAAEYLDPNATFIRPANQPVDPATDLVTKPSKKSDGDSGDEKSDSAEKKEEDLPEITVSSN